MTGTPEKPERARCHQLVFQWNIGLLPVGIKGFDSFWNAGQIFFLKDKELGECVNVQMCKWITVIHGQLLPGLPDRQ